MQCRLDFKLLRLPKFQQIFTGTPFTLKQIFTGISKILNRFFHKKTGVPVMKKNRQEKCLIWRSRYFKSALLHAWTCSVAYTRPPPCSEYYVGVGASLPPVTHFKTLQYTVIHCTTLHHTASHCNTLHHTAPHCITVQHSASHKN